MKQRWFMILKMISTVADEASDCGSDNDTNDNDNEDDDDDDNDDAYYDD